MLMQTDEGWSTKPKLQKIDEKSYPLVTCLNEEGLSEEIVDTREMVKRTVDVKFSFHQAGD